ncbi:hypothetical protein IQ273_21320 [Nodosilinea sp. LEGE 07298]|uniref:hypothetical protein n=1 Tax=Nodosilinea sp. LEGE 07298 TaxID=2777970 RepID=UPI0018817ED6|nr:hypothetical protein [Nodosilinea sp. LEGE 07298]MBE9111951.1 hypothetical protein [Nodosilinea sp. LEGE 07298]
MVKDWSFMAIASRERLYKTKVGRQLTRFPPGYFHRIGIIYGSRFFSATFCKQGRK